MTEDETNHPYDLLQLFWPVVSLFAGIAIGGGLVLLYLTH